MTKQASVMIVGIDPSLVEFERFPGLTKERLETEISTAEEDLRTSGYVVSSFQIRDIDTAAKDLSGLLSNRTVNVVVFGAGLIRDADNHLLFEDLINVVGVNAPQARMAINSLGPSNTLSSADRALSMLRPGMAPDAQRPPRRKQE